MEPIFSNESNAKAMAFFCRRVTFDDAYKRAHGDTFEERNRMAYEILRAFGELENYLNKLGVLPR